MAGRIDNFTFSYSRDNVVYTPMVTVRTTTDDDALQAFAFPQDVAGTVYVRVQDTHGTAGNIQLDSVFVDFLSIATLFQEKAAARMSHSPRRIQGEGPSASRIDVGRCHHGFGDDCA